MVAVPDILTDPDRDWAPITLGSEVTVGDFILASIGQSVTLGDVDNTVEGETTFKDGVGTTFAVITDADLIETAFGYKLNLYRVIPKPAADDRYIGSDGSEWIYPDDASLSMLCYRSSSVASGYKQGARFLIGDLRQRITLTPLT